MFGGGFLGGTVDGRRFALRWSAGGGQHYLVDGRVIQDERTSRVVLRFRSEPLPKWLTGILLAAASLGSLRLYGWPAGIIAAAVVLMVAQDDRVGLVPSRLVAEVVSRVTSALDAEQLSDESI